MESGSTKRLNFGLVFTISLLKEKNECKINEAIVNLGTKYKLVYIALLFKYIFTMSITWQNTNICHTEFSFISLIIIVLLIFDMYNK